jgi:hypothetical protein
MLSKIKALGFINQAHFGLFSKYDVLHQSLVHFKGNSAKLNKVFRLRFHECEIRYHYRNRRDLIGNERSFAYPSTAELNERFRVSKVPDTKLKETFESRRIHVTFQIKILERENSRQFYQN